MVLLGEHLYLACSSCYKRVLVSYRNTDLCVIVTIFFLFFRSMNMPVQGWGMQMQGGGGGGSGGQFNGQQGMMGYPMQQGNTPSFNSGILVS